MFKQAVIHYPKDENILTQIGKDIADFRYVAVVKYIESLNLNDSQIKTLLSSLKEDICAKKQESA